MILTTTPTIEGKTIQEYRGIVVGEAILGANVFRDLFAGLRDIIGGRSGAYEKELGRAREIAFEELQEGRSGDDVTIHEIRKESERVPGSVPFAGFQTVLECLYHVLHKFTTKVVVLGVEQTNEGRVDGALFRLVDHTVGEQAQDNGPECTQVSLEHRGEPLEVGL